jgi:hypothetical protein
VREFLQYIRIVDGDLIVQLDGGGAAQRFARHDSGSEVIFRLRMLADSLERGMMNRLRAADQVTEP